MEQHQPSTSAKATDQTEGMTLSLFSSLSSKESPRLITLEEVHQMLVSDTALKENTEKYRYFLQQGFTDDADRIKRSKSPAFTPAAVFYEKRQYKHLLRISGYSLADFDDLNEEQLAQALELLKEDPYWVLIYTTLSGKGLRIIYPVKGVTDRASYTKAFQQGNAYYSRLLGLEYDPQVCDLTRPSVICHDPDARYRPDASPYPVNYNLLSVEEAWSNVENRLKRKKLVYEPGTHNQYISQACYLLNKYGVPEEKVLEWAEARFIDYADEGGVERIVRSCYSHKEEHATLKADKFQAKESEPKYATVEETEEYLSELAEFRYNEITRMNEIRWKEEGQFRPMTDRDEGSLWRRICKERKPLRFNDMRLVLTSEFVPLFSPFKDYFYHLPAWNPGDTDYIRLLADTVQLADPSPIARSTFERCLKKWLVAMIAGFLSDRVNHEILVFIGQQGIFKTTWFHYLLPPELRTYYVAKSNTRRMSKDDRLLMAESGLICLEEIVTMTDEEVDQIKAAASLPQIVERAAYARNKEVRPHLASFCGTGNHVQFLTDTSGNRRWLPFEVKNILSPYDHPIEYTGLYSQVMHLWQSGFVYWFDQEEIRSLEEHLSNFESPSMEEELILTHYRKPQPGEQGKFVSTADVVVRINAGVKTPLSPIKVGRLMRKLNFERTRSNSGQRGFRVHEYSLEEIQANKLHFSVPEQGKLEF